jgi:hypothetical protein
MLNIDILWAVSLDFNSKTTKIYKKTNLPRRQPIS